MRHRIERFTKIKENRSICLLELGKAPCVYKSSQYVGHLHKANSVRMHTIQLRCCKLSDIQHEKTTVDFRYR